LRFFVILRMSRRVLSNFLSSVFTSYTAVPLPPAMRFFLSGPMILWFLRSALVIERMIASYRFISFSSSLEGSTAPRAPGIISSSDSRLPIYRTRRNWSR